MIRRLVRSRAGGVALLAALLLCATQTFAATRTSETVLGNGMRVIVKEDHRAPVVVSMVWYQAGSMDEVNGTTGVAHVLEHMMFKGTKNVPSRRVHASSSRPRVDATTPSPTATTPPISSRCTNPQLPLTFRLEADRMANLNLSPTRNSRRRSRS